MPTCSSKDVRPGTSAIKARYVKGLLMHGAQGAQRAGAQTWGRLHESLLQSINQLPNQPTN